MSPFQPDNPSELAARPRPLVCRAHFLADCSVCTIKGNFLSDESFASKNDGKSQPIHTSALSKYATIVGRQQEPNHVAPDVSCIFPTAFKPPRSTDTPATLFTRGIAERLNVPGFDVADHHRLIRPGTKEIIIFTDGACVRNSQEDAVAGCSFVFRPASKRPPLLKYGSYSLRLEDRGPHGNIQP